MLRPILFSSLVILSSQALAQSASWEVTRLGLLDADHTDSGTPEQYSYPDSLNASGQAVGISYRYVANVQYASDQKSVWFYDGIQTRRLGLIDSTHTRSDGLQNSILGALGDAGYVLGYSQRFGNFTSGYGTSDAWLYNSNTDTYSVLGLHDSAHQRSDGTENQNAEFLNGVGQAAGTAVRFNTYGQENGKSAWFFDGSINQRIGFFDSNHTSTNGSQFSSVRGLTDSGLVFGTSNRYVGSSSVAATSWVYSGGQYTNLGLSGQAFTNTAYGTTTSGITHVNKAGQAVGTTLRYQGATQSGRSAWIYQNGASVEIGLTGTQHFGTDGSLYNDIDSLNETGQVIGHNTKYSGSGYIGRAAWFYNGSQSSEVGLRGTGYSRASDGYQYVDAQFLTDSGWVAGQSNRYNGDIFLGLSAWVDDGSGASQVGYVDAQHTRDDGYQESSIEFINESGQIVGSSLSYTGGVADGISYWFYDTMDAQYFDLHFANSDQVIAIDFLSDDGVVLGRYSDSSHIYSQAFYFSPDEGILDLQDYLLLHGVDVAAEGWTELRNASYINELGQIIGTGRHVDDVGGKSTFLLTSLASPVPVPAAVWMFAAALISLAGLKRRG